MRVSFLILALFFTFSVAEAKPFRRALILSGGGTMAAMKAGVLDGAVRAGFVPDVVITTCGASLMGTISNTHASEPALSERVLEAMRSRETYDLMRTLTLAETSPLKIASRMNEFTRDTALLPDVFGATLLNMPQSFAASSISETFSSEGMRTIMIATRVDFAPSEVGARRRDRKMFTETYFTDVDTAQHLQGLRSAIGLQFPGSSIALETAVVTDVSPAAAARGSISDPLLLPPGWIGERAYMTGAMNNYPVELAQEIADEVLVAYPGDWQDYERQIIYATFGFDPLERSYQVSLRGDVRFYASPRPGEKLENARGERIGFEPYMKGLRLQDGFDVTYAEYLRNVEDQIALGRASSLEALKQTIGSLAHIRKRIEKPRKLRVKASRERD